MALKLLAGPYPVTVNGLTHKFMGVPFYLEEYGLVGRGQHMSPPYPFGAVIVQLDGTGYIRNNSVTGFNHEISYDATRDSLISHPGSALDYTHEEYDPLTCMKGTVVFTSIFRGAYTQLSDRKIYPSFEGITANEKYTVRKVNDDGSTVLEYTFTGIVSYTTGGESSISPMLEGNYCFSWGLTGVIFTYDPVAKTQVGPFKTIGMPHVGLWYSQKFDIYISAHKIISGGTHTHDEIRLWANETQPASISTPIALTPVAKAHSSIIQVQVLGADNDVCAGVLVDWTATIGTLAASQTTTDENGYAEVLYTGPNQNGNVDIVATVTI